jgi:hypothetical protein
MQLDLALADKFSVHVSKLEHGFALIIQLSADLQAVGKGIAFY